MQPSLFAQDVMDTSQGHGLTIHPSFICTEQRSPSQALIVSGDHSSFLSDGSMNEDLFQDSAADHLFTSMQLDEGPYIDNTPGNTDELHAVGSIDDEDMDDTESAHIVHPRSYTHQQYSAPDLVAESQAQSSISVADRSDRQDNASVADVIGKSDLSLKDGMDEDGEGEDEGDQSEDASDEEGEDGKSKDASDEEGEDGKSKDASDEEGEDDESKDASDEEGEGGQSKDPDDQTKGNSNSQSHSTTPTTSKRSSSRIKARHPEGIAVLKKQDLRKKRKIAPASYTDSDESDESEENGPISSNLAKLIKIKSSSIWAPEITEEIVSFIQFFII